MDEGVHNIRPAGQSLVILGVLIPLTIIATAALGMRVFVKSGRQTLGWEDALMILGTASIR